MAAVSAASKLVVPPSTSALMYARTFSLLASVARTSVGAKLAASAENETTVTKSASVRVSTILTPACRASAMRFSLCIEPLLSMIITTSLGPEAAEAYQGRKRGS